MPTAPIIPTGMCPLSSKNSRACTGMKACALLAVCMLCVSCSGKSTSERLREVEFTAQENQNNMAEVSHRVKALESRVDGLTGEVRQVSTRTYEVRNKAGRKTGMTAHAIIPPAPVVATPPAGVPVNPAGTISGTVPATEPVAAPQKPKAPLPAMSQVPPPMAVPGQPQATRGNPSPNLSLPPTETISQATAVTSATPRIQVTSAPSSVTVAPIPAAQSQPAQRQPAVKSSAQAAQTAIPAVQIPQTPQDSLALPPESAAAPAVQSAPRTAPIASGKLPSAVKGEEGAYKAALSLVMSGRAAEGRQKFNDFLQTYPSGRYAANAHYWIGESYYSQGNYSEALMSFKQVSSQFPRHHKTADALLKAGMTYQKLGDKENAQLQYKALQSDFPNSEAAGRIRRSGR